MPNCKGLGTLSSWWKVGKPRGSKSWRLMEIWGKHHRTTIPQTLLGIFLGLLYSTICFSSSQTFVNFISWEPLEFNLLPSHCYMGLQLLTGAADNDARHLTWTSLSWFLMLTISGEPSSSFTVCHGKRPTYRWFTHWKIWTNPLLC